MSRANKYATPTHNARTTKTYSVSLPVRRVSSQRSNISTRGQTKQVSKTSATVGSEARDRIERIIAPSTYMLGTNFVL